MSSPRPLHFVAFPFSLLSHARQLLCLVVSLIQDNTELTFTVFSYKPAVHTIEAEIARAHLDSSERSRIRLIGIVEQEATEPGLRPLWENIKEAFPVAYRTVAEGGEIRCANTGATFDYANLPKPSLVMYDMAIPGVAQEVREVTPEAKILVDYIMSAGSFIRHYGPPSLSGLGECEEVVTKQVESRKDGKSLYELAMEYEHGFKGQMYKCPEKIQVFEEETSPQIHHGHVPYFLIWESARQVRIHADGAIISSTPEFEPNATASIQSWYKDDLGKDVFFVGPRFHKGQFAFEIANQQSTIHPSPSWTATHQNQFGS